MGGLSPRRARRAVAFGLLFLLAFHLGLNLALDTVKPEWRDPEFGWRMKRLAELDHSRAGRPLVVALGSSRTQMGFSPSDMPAGDATVFNMGQAGAGPLYQLLNFRRVLDAGIRPDVVLIEIMPPALSNDAPAELLFAKQVPKLGYRDLARLAPYCDDPGVLRRQWAGVRVAPWYSLRFYLMSHALPGFLPWQQRVDFQWRMMDATGWSGYPFDAISDADRARGVAAVRKDYEEGLKAFRIAPRQDRVLRDLIERCRCEGIHVGLYRMPESPTFRSWYPPQVRMLLNEYMAGLSREYGVPVFDASDWLPEEVFADGHHLMKAGGREFSRRFGRECLGPWLARE
jgi:hypothetical protein